ncbi:MAG: VapE domain-containing protein, partial [Hominilimicola sp.]
GDLDEDAKDGTPVNKLPSFIKMNELAAADEDVKKLLIHERIQSANEDFADSDWQLELDIDKQGQVKATLDNLMLILRNDEGLKNIAFNRHRDGIDARGGLPWEQIKDGWNDSDNAALKVYINHKYGVYSPTKTKDAVLTAASERAYHPIKEYLESLPPWDGVGRIDNLLRDYFGADDNSYTRAVIRKSITAAVARIYQPGIKFDSVLILNGPQGIGKSTFFSKLAGKWFSDSLTVTDMKDKAGPEKLQGYWILELGELAGMRKTEAETVKSFISRVDDKYRASYGISVENHPRQCIIVGSTNAEDGFLRDITGNRRFWPVKVSGNSEKKPWQITNAEVHQIWAEALVLYKNGEKLYLEGEDAETAVQEQADAMETDEREGLVRAYLDTLLPENWDDMNLYERRNFLNGNDFGADECTGTVRRDTVCNMEIWCECFEKDRSAMEKSDAYKISAMMEKIEGWTKSGYKYYSAYGKQRIYTRNNK